MSTIMSGIGKAGAVFAIGLGLYGVVRLLVGPAEPPAAESGYGTDRSACTMAERFVQEKLKTPSTAKFLGNCKATYSGTTELWNTHGSVDAQNIYGAMVRYRYVAQVRYEGRDNSGYRWNLISVDLIEAQ